MHKGRIILIVVAILAILSAVIYFVMKATKKTDVPASKTASGSTGTANFPLKYGSKSEAVKLLQLFLNKNFGSELTADGIWGAKTQTAFAYMFSLVNFLSSDQLMTEAEFNANIRSV